MKWLKDPRSFPLRIFLVALLLRLVPVIALRSMGIGLDDMFQYDMLALFLIGYITPHLFIIAEDRFHLTIVPFLAILAAYCWTGGWSALRARWQTRGGKLAQLLGPNGNISYFPY
jgi:hypothetical protein